MNILIPVAGIVLDNEVLKVWPASYWYCHLSTQLQGNLTVQFVSDNLVLSSAKLGNVTISSELIEDLTLAEA